MNMLRLASLSLLLLFGCNDAAVPLGPVETAPMNIELSGIWEPDVQTGSEVESVMILPFNEHEYYVALHSTETDPEEETLSLRGFITPMDGLYFANLQLLTGEVERGNYLIYQFDLSDDDLLTLKHIDHDMSHIKTSEELREFVKGIIKTNAFDEDDIILFRKKEMDD